MSNSQERTHTITKINAIPHHRAVTNSSHHFKRIADGFAEFFDNSIQACRFNSQGYIRLSIHLSSSNKTGFAVIMDNGCGMDTAAIQDFATFSLDQESRETKDKIQGIVRTQQNQSEDSKHFFLSKFGVGAKHAGFFLGDRIRLITKPKSKSTHKSTIIKKEIISEPITTKKRENKKNLTTPEKCIIIDVDNDDDDNDNAINNPPQISSSSYSSSSSSSTMESSVERSNNDNNCVNELILDAIEMDKKFHENGNNLDVYNYSIIHRPLLQYETTQPIDEKEFPQLSQEILEFEQNNNHFTIIIIKLRIENIKKLLYKDNCIDLAKSLSQIYFFHLHPEYTFDTINDESSKDNIIDFKRINNRSISFEEKKQQLIPLDIDYNVYRDGTGKFTIHESLKYTKNYFLSCMESAAAGLLFTIDMRDPNYQYDDSSSSTTSSSSTALTQGNSNKKKHIVPIILLYYPFQDGVETKPSLVEGFETYDTAQVAESSSSAAVALTQNTRQAATAAAMMTQSNLTQGNNIDSSSALPTTTTTANDSDIFYVFWQHRLVPDTTVKELPFFNKIKDKNPTSSLIADYWKYRVKGFMFLDWHFDHITNNKLQIRIDPNFNEWINNKRARDQDHILYSTARFEETVSKWLGDVHKKYDQDYFLMQRNKEMEIKYKDSINSKSYFDFLKIGNTCNLERNKDIIKLYLNPKLKDTSTKSKKQKDKEMGTNIIYGRIYAFESDTKLSDDVTKYNGPFKMIVIREPTKVYGDEEHQIRLDSNKLTIRSIMMKDNNYVKVQQKDLKKLTELIPHSVTVSLFILKELQPNDLSTYATTGIMAGEKFYKLGIQIKNESGQVITSPPNIDLKKDDKRYRIRCQIRQQNTSLTGVDISPTRRNSSSARGQNSTHNTHGNTGDYVVIYDYGEAVASKALYYYDSKENEDRLLSLKDSMSRMCENAHYSYYGTNNSQPSLEFTHCGSYYLHITVHDDHRCIYTAPPFPFKVNSKDVQRFEIVPHDLEVWRIPIRLGERLPSFKVYFKDSSNNNVELDGNIGFTLTHPKIQVTYDNKKSIGLPMLRPRRDDDPITSTQSTHIEGACDHFEFHGDVQLWKTNLDENDTFFKEDSAKAIRTKFTLEVETFQREEYINKKGEQKVKTINRKRLGEPVDFELNICPGYPTTLDIDMSNFNINADYIHGQMIPILRFFCKDKWGHRTSCCEENQIWRIVFDPLGPLKSNPVRVLSSGVVSVKDCKIQLHDLCQRTLDNRVIQIVYLDTNVSVEDEDETDMGAHLDISHLRKNCLIRCELLLKCVSSSIPHSVKLAQNDIPYEESEIHTTIGHTLNNLSFLLYDESNQLLPFTAYWFEGKGTGYTTNWSTSRKKLEPIHDNTLPPLTMKEVGEIPYELKLHLINGQVLTCDYTFIIKPEQPTTWRILTTPKWEEGLYIRRQKKKETSNTITTLSQMNALLDKVSHVMTYTQDDPPSHHHHNPHYQGMHISDPTTNNADANDPTSASHDDLYTKFIGIELADRYGNTVSCIDYPHLFPQLLLRPNLTTTNKSTPRRSPRQDIEDDTDATNGVQDILSNRKRKMSSINPVTPRTPNKRSTFEPTTTPYRNGNNTHNNNDDQDEDIDENSVYLQIMPRPVEDKNGNYIYKLKPNQTISFERDDTKSMWFVAQTDMKYAQSYLTKNATTATTSRSNSSSISSSANTSHTGQLSLVNAANIESYRKTCILVSGPSSHHKVHCEPQTPATYEDSAESNLPPFIFYNVNNTIESLNHLDIAALDPTVSRYILQVLKYQSVKFSIDLLDDNEDPANTHNCKNLKITLNLKKRPSNLLTSSVNDDDEMNIATTTDDDGEVETPIVPQNSTNESLQLFYHTWKTMNDSSYEFDWTECFSTLRYQNDAYYTIINHPPESETEELHVCIGQNETKDDDNDNNYDKKLKFIYQCKKYTLELLISYQKKEKNVYSSIIECYVPYMDIIEVIQIHPSLLMSTMNTSTTDPMSTFTTTNGLTLPHISVENNEFPSFYITLSNLNQMTILPDTMNSILVQVTKLNDIYVMTKHLGTKTMMITPDDYYVDIPDYMESLTIDPDNKRIICTPKSIYHHKSGIYRINVTYMENRNYYEYLPDNIRETSETFDFAVTPSVIHSIQIDNTHKSKLMNMTVSNSNTSQSARVLIDELTLYFYDKYHNQTIVSPQDYIANHIQVIMSIQASTIMNSMDSLNSTDSSYSDTPILVTDNNNSNNVLIGTLLPTVNGVTFTNVTIQPDTCNKDGIYYLHIQLMDSASGIDIENDTNITKSRKIMSQSSHNYDISHLDTQSTSVSGVLNHSSIKSIIENTGYIIIPFQFTTNQSVLLAMQNYQKQMIPLQTELTELRQQEIQLKQRIEMLNADINDQVNKTNYYKPRANTQESNSLVGFTQQDIRKYTKDIEKECLDRKRYFARHPIRPVKKPITTTNSNGSSSYNSSSGGGGGGKNGHISHSQGTAVGILSQQTNITNHSIVSTSSSPLNGLRQVVDIGYVDDDKLVRILSWAAQNLMDAYIVDTYQESLALFRQGKKSWAIDQMTPFRIHHFPSTTTATVYNGQSSNNGQKKQYISRSKEEKDNQILPFRSLSHLPGSPEYMVNLIQLRHEDEDMRDTVIFNLFNQSLLFDTMEHALQYRQECIRNHKMCPTLFTRQGEKVDSKGTLNPQKGQGICPENLTFMFGQLPSKDLIELNYLEEELQILTQVVEMRTELDKLKVELDNLEILIDEKQTMIQQLEYDHRH